MKLKRLADAYAFLALLLLNCLLLFIALNIAALLVLRMQKAADDPVSRKYGQDAVRAVYPDLSDKEVQGLLKETWSRPYLYEPFTQFTERPFRGTYVNVQPAGYRQGVEQGPWPLAGRVLNIFVFGGSTAFGYGVQDHQTIPSHLQNYLRTKLTGPVNVYNFGRGFYFSTQERILFEKLLSEGAVPSVALFIDGLNEFYHADGEPQMTQRIAQFIDSGAVKFAWAAKLPLVRLAQAWGPGQAGAGARNAGQESPGVSARAPQAAVIERYFQNKKMIEAVAAAYGVRVGFIWQPVPTFNYDATHHLFAAKNYGAHELSREGYAQMQKRLSKPPHDRHFLWAADIQHGLAKPLYVDQVHYTAEFSKAFAGYIGHWLVTESTLVSGQALH